MKNLKDIITERLHITKRSKVNNLHTSEDIFPFETIGIENECYTLNHNGNNWRMLYFRKYIMEVYKKTKYKDVLFSYTDSVNKTIPLYYNSIYKDRGCPACIFLSNKYENDNIEEIIEQDGYKKIQSRISNASTLNKSILLDIRIGDLPTIRTFKIENIHISCSDTYKCITINILSI